MDSFNLLPSEYQSRWKIQWVPIIIVATILICVGSILMMEWHLGRMRNTRVVAETSHRRHKDIAKLDYLASRVEILKKDYESLESLLTDHVVWSNLLIELSGMLPEGVVLDSISINAIEGTCGIHGTAPGSQNVLVFKDKLKEVSGFAATEISTIARNPSGKGKEVAYEISCRFR